MSGYDDLELRFDRRTVVTVVVVATIFCGLVACSVVLAING